jgi:hypothetical protein
LVAAEAEAARREDTIDSAEARSALDQLAREVSRLISEELREIEADEPPGPGEGAAPLLALIPEQAFAYMGEDRVLTVAARNDGISVGDEVTVETDPIGVVEVLTPSLSLNRHPRRGDVLIGQLHLRPLIPDESAMITAKLHDRISHALIEVRPERILIEEEIVPPDTLRFERLSYRLSWNRERQLLIEAPLEQVASFGTRLMIDSADSGVVIRTPHVALRLDESTELYRAYVKVDPRVLGASSIVTARLAGVTATTLVSVSRREDGPAFRIRPVQEEYGAYRAIIESERDKNTGEEIKIVKVAGLHPSMRPYIGDRFEGLNTAICRTLVAEAVADAAARFIVSELYRLRRGTEDFSAERIYREHYKRVTRFLPRFQRILVGDGRAFAHQYIPPEVSILEMAPATG